MKIASSLVVLLCASTVSLARDTAYQALRAVGTERGQEILNHVIEVDGRAGAPQPKAWRIVLEDQAARGGVRELEVINGKVAAERTPVNANTGAVNVMDFQKLNLDSAGAFTIAEKEASKAHVGFDSADYTLRSGDEGRSPVWVVQLLDQSHHTVGTMHIAADTGALVRSDLYGRQGGAPVVHDIGPDEHVAADTTIEDTGDTDEDHPRLRVGHRINKALHQAGATLEEFFTGKRTIDRKYRDDQQDAR